MPTLKWRRRAGLVVLAALGLPCSAPANPGPNTEPVASHGVRHFPGADLANGRELHDSKQCAACHTEKTTRDEGFIYRRDDRKVRTLYDLRRYVSLCNMELKLELFPEDERDVAAFLNQQFYKLDR